MPNDVLSLKIAAGAATSDLPLRIRRLRVRCRARGTKELCVLLDRFLLRFEGELDEMAVAEVEELLLESDDDILLWFCSADSWPERHEHALRRLRLASDLTDREGKIH